MRVSEHHQHPCQFVIVKQKSQGRKHKNRFGEVARNSHSRKQAAGQSEPWLLATSLPITSTLAKKVVKLYRTRMQIEEGFRDVKSHRFGLSLNYHRTESVERLQILLLIAALALVVLWLMGMAVMLLEQHYQYQANSVRHKKVLSVIFIGLQVIHDTRIRLSKLDIESAWHQLTAVQTHHGWD